MYKAGKVLVVDDYEPNLLGLRQLLEHADYTVLTATNGRDQATAILSGSDALVAAATAAERAMDAAGSFEHIDDEHPHADEFRDYYRDRAILNAQVAQGLSVYAATVGRWAAR